MARAKVVLIGAGSASFGLDTLHGIFREAEAFDGATLTLVDVDAGRLEAMRRFAEHACDAEGVSLTIEATVDRAEALPAADYVIVSVDVDRVDAWQKDFDIPTRHGIRHILGENGGPGGLSHSLRSVPIVLDICRDVESLAPDALVINYTNPMSRVCLALTRYTNLRVIGLCHQIGYGFYTVGTTLGWITAERGSPGFYDQLHAVFERVDMQACGLNHLTFITSLRDRETGADLYPTFRERLASSDPSFEPVCRRLHDVFGLYPTSGDTHAGEYLAWAHLNPHRPDFRHRHEQGAEKVARLARALSGEISVRDALHPLNTLPLDRAPAIIAAAMQARTQSELAVNVVNEGAIAGLPDWAIVEVPALITGGVLKPVAMGPLPPAITALLQQQVAIQDRVVEAAVNGDLTAARQAMLLDPVANQDATVADELLAELLTEHRALLPAFQ